MFKSVQPQTPYLQHNKHNSLMLEQIISFIAPHQCLHCDREGTLLCPEAQQLLSPARTKCYLCSKTLPAGLLCIGCEPDSPLEYVIAATTYESYAKQLVAKLKFERANAAANPMACVMSAYIPKVSAGTVLVHVPTASVRIRSRGYDQAALLARRLSRLAHLPRASLLLRSGQQRQLGQTRVQRQKQLAGAFHVLLPSVCQNRSFLLIDDVFTTGSTIESAARVLKNAGAKQVGALVFAAA